MRMLRDVLQQLPASADNGLTLEGIAQSRTRFGGTRLTPLPREPLWKKFLEKFDEPIIKILLAAALLSMVVDLFKGAPAYVGAGFGRVVVVVAAGMLVGALRQWLPSMLFGAAVVLLGVGLAT